jgi:copper chaperone CopZ
VIEGKGSKMAKVVFQVKPLNCAGCVKSIKDQLYSQQGIVSVKVFPQLGKVRAAFDESKIDVNQLAKFMTNLGYTVQLKI